MTLRRLVPLSLVLVLVLLLGTTGQSATGEAQGNPSSPDAPVGDSITYQGQLKDDAGNPINGTCALRFQLFNAEILGVQVGASQELKDVNLVNGYFTVLLNFGKGAFNGDARWLEAAVKCGAELNYTVLFPRQELTPTPYALNADLLDGEHATAFADAAHTHWGDSWTGSGTGLTLSSDTTGLSGLATAATGTTYGLRGESQSSSGRGVYGIVNAADGFTYGVYGVSESTQGRGVYGSASATSGDTYGVFGSSASSTGRGVYGYGSHNTGFNYGVYGETDSSIGHGVYGYANEASGVATGVYGRTESTGGFGVYGYADAITGQNYGVYGTTYSNEGRAVSGFSGSLTGTTYGVLGTSVSPSGIGVYGYATDKDGGATARGVVGRSDSPNGWGVQGHAVNNTGTGLGVYARSDAADGFGVVGNATYGGVGVGAWSESGNLIEAYDGTYPGGSLRFYVTQGGDVYTDGTFYTFPLNHADGQAHALATIHSSEAWLEDFGQASLLDGMALVSIASDFAGVADLNAEYFVFVTLEGDCQGVYVTNKTPGSFEVHEMNAGKSSIPFAYRLVARPAGFENVRLPLVTLPDPVDVTGQLDQTDQPPELLQGPPVLDSDQAEPELRP